MFFALAYHNLLFFQYYDHDYTFWVYFVHPSRQVTLLT